jgi:hypothetical protein
MQPEHTLRQLPDTCGSVRDQLEGRGHLKAESTYLRPNSWPEAVAIINAHRRSSVCRCRARTAYCGGWRRCACLDAETRVLAVGVLASTTCNNSTADLLLTRRVPCHCHLPPARRWACHLPLLVACCRMPDGPKTWGLGVRGPGVSPLQAASTRSKKKPPQVRRPDFSVFELFNAAWCVRTPQPRGTQPRHRGSVAPWSASFGPRQHRV